jgi:TonB family protein
MTVLTTWLVHCGVIAAVLACAAAAWEVSARWSGRPARWAWLGAMAGTVTLPWLLRLIPSEPLTGAVPTAMPLFTLDPVVLATTAQSAGWSAVDVALVAWLVVSLATAAWVVRTLVQLGRARHEWRRAEVDGGSVYVTRDTGPAALGVRRGIVVVPSWALALDVELRRLLLLHEREHVRAGDPRVLMAGLVLLATMPWNPLLWFQLLRLRNAIELDCDARVLSRGVDPERYGSLLLEVGRRRAGSALVMATFAEPRIFLRERIRRIASWPVERRPGRAWLFAALAFGLFATALSARDPLQRGPGAVTPPTSPAAEIAPPIPVSPVPVDAPSAAADVTEALTARVPGPLVSDTPPVVPTFTPMTVAPTLRNREEVTHVLQSLYPPLLKDAGIGGRPTVHFYIDETGEVQRLLLARSSGYPALDEAALAVAATMRFSPAFNRDQRVPVWIELPVIFAPPSSETAQERDRRAQLEERAAAARARAAAAGTGEQRAQLERELRAREQAQDGPVLLNREEVARAVEQNYPPILRDAGIGGAIALRVLVRSNGQVGQVEVRSTSGYPALDEAAKRVAGMMRFRPAQHEGRPIDAWTAVPVIFSTGERPVEAPVRAREVPTREVPARELPPPPQTPPPANIAERPVFTPMTVAPELTNRGEVQRLLERNYPPVLRDAGIGGHATAHLFIDTDGSVRQVRIGQSTGYPALDEAALTVARAMKFSPALNRDRIVPVWIELPIIFAAR